MRIAFALLLFLCVGIAPVLACSIATPNPEVTATPVPTIEDYTQSATVIFVGTVVRELASSDYGGYDYLIQVERYLKGDGYDTVILNNYHDLCMYGLTIGQEFIFFVQVNESNKAIASYEYFELSLLSDESRVTNITGQANPPEALPLDVQLSRLLESDDLNWFYIGMSVFAALVGLLAVGLSLRMRGRRKSKAKRDVID